MNYHEDIDNAINLLVTELYEPEENTLQFNLIIGQVSELSEEVLIGEKKLNRAYRVQFTDNTKIFKVYFDSYICYNVINESFEQLGGANFIGNKIRIYTDSNFLKYVKADTFATSKYPGEFKHYSFITTNHIINVAWLKIQLFKNCNNDVL